MISFQNRVHNSAIRKGHWKLVRNREAIDSKSDPPSWELYDLSSDVGEKKNIAEEQGQIVQELNQVFNRWRKSMHPSLEPKKRGGKKKKKK
jgi:arylsulfatase A-like enzyme